MFISYDVRLVVWAACFKIIFHFDFQATVAPKVASSEGVHECSTNGTNTGTSKGVSSDSMEEHVTKETSKGTSKGVSSDGMEEHVTKETSKGTSKGAAKGIAKGTIKANWTKAAVVSRVASSYITGSSKRATKRTTSESTEEHATRGTTKGSSSECTEEHSTKGTSKVTSKGTSKGASSNDMEEHYTKGTKKVTNSEGMEEQSTKGASRRASSDGVEEQSTKGASRRASSVGVEEHATKGTTKGAMKGSVKGAIASRTASSSGMATNKGTSRGALDNNATKGTSKGTSSVGMQEHSSKETHKETSSDGTKATKETAKETMKETSLSIVEHFIMAAAEDDTEMEKIEKPAIVKSYSTVKAQQNIHLKFDADIYIGFGMKEVILPDDDSKKLVKYSIDKKYCKEWTKDVPDGFEWHSDIFITPSLIVCQHNDSHTTMTFSHNLEPQETYTQHCGDLCGTIPPNRLLYAKKISKDNYRVDIYELPDHSQIGSLSRARNPFKYHEISVSCHMSTHWLAVVMYGGYGGSPTLDIYDSAYNHRTHVVLPYMPLSINSVAAVKHWIFIVNDTDDCIHIYNWNGEELGTMTNQQLGLHDEQIYGIHGIERGFQRNLSIAAGRPGVVKSLHLYYVP